MRTITNETVVYEPITLKSILSKVYAFINLAIINLAVVMVYLAVTTVAIHHFFPEASRVIRFAVIENVMMTTSEKEHMHAVESEVIVLRYKNQELKNKLDAAMVPEATVGEFFNNRVATPVKEGASKAADVVNENVVKPVKNKTGEFYEYVKAKF